MLLCERRRPLTRAAAPGRRERRRAPLDVSAVPLLLASPPGRELPLEVAPSGRGGQDYRRQHLDVDARQRLGVGSNRFEVP